MKKVLGIIVFFSLFSNIGFSEILKLDKNLEIKIPKKYKYFEINASDLIKLESDISELFEGSEDNFGWNNPKIILMAKKNETISLFEDYFSPNGSNIIMQQVQEHYEKVGKKKGKTWARKMQKNENKLVKFAVLEFFKLYKLDEFYIFIIGDEELDFMADVTKTNEIKDEELNEFINEIEGKGGKSYIEKQIKNFFYDEFGKEFSKLKKNKYNVYEVNYDFSDINNLYLSFYTLIKWYSDNVFVTKSDGETFFSITNNKLIYANSICLKKTNCKNMPKINTILNYENFTDGTKIKVETKPKDTDITNQLEKLNDLYKSGALTKEEFEKAKKKILN
jgi:hypothetical protein